MREKKTETYFGHFPQGFSTRLIYWRGIRWSPGIKKLHLASKRRMKPLSHTEGLFPIICGCNMRRYCRNVLPSVLSVARCVISNLTAGAAEELAGVCEAKTLLAAPVGAIFPLELSSREEIPPWSLEAWAGWPNHIRTMLNIDLEYAQCYSLTHRRDFQPQRTNVKF